MSLGLMFWILCILWLISGLWSSWPLTSATAKSQAGNLLLFLLVVIIGWKVFGPVIQGG
jgi:hypothetical protein